VIVCYLRELGYDVTYVRNITDIDDKIIRRALEQGEEIGELTGRFIGAMREDSEMLFVEPPDTEPRATRHIDEIVAMVEKLVGNGLAYRGAGGDVYFRVRKFPNYGRLLGENLDDLRAGARVEADSEKEDPLDFVLWKAAKPNEPRWESPWGAGRPGWHIECSAMSTRCLGNHFDIHAGGMDLRFPHHDNEIAQSEGATGETFANYWLHNGYVQVDKEKMSKSLGNFFTIREILDQDSNPRRMGEVIRYMILASHYRSPLNYSDETLANARAALTRFYLALQKLAEQGIEPGGGVDGDFDQRFHAAMDDDFNTPEAIAVLFDLVRELNRALDAADRARAAALAGELKRLAGVLGVLNLEVDSFLGRGKQAGPVAGNLTAQEIDDLAAERNQARREKNWSRADEIRDQLKALNVVLEDKPDGATTWRINS
ncbi:MAG: cysteine--tRNA ligase, partial [Pseudomonadota bacterium]|nr:cysteine--tRNA ligase [Pseudomonadota bacterium]